jgi:hypothetical protein
MPSLNDLKNLKKYIDSPYLNNMWTLTENFKDTPLLH